MIKIIEAMYDLANEEDRTGEKSPDKRVDLIMQRLNKDKDGKRSGFVFLYYENLFIGLHKIEIVLRNEFIQGCLRDELLRKILAPNTAMLVEDEPINTTTLILTDENM